MGQSRQVAAVAHQTTAPLRISAVAARLGVSPSTLRSWERRYGLSPSARSDGSHRYYTREDLARLTTMRELTSSGVPPAEAAKAVLVENFDVSTSSHPKFQPQPSASNIDIEYCSPPVKRLVKMATSLDAVGIQRTIDVSLAERTVIPSWQDLMAPTLRILGDVWAQTGEGVEHEHLAADCFSNCLARYEANRSGHRSEVLLAAAPGERHDLPLRTVGAALAERYVKSITLGPEVPESALSRATKHVSPDALVLWALLPETYLSPEAVHQLQRETTLVLAGPGWDAAEFQRGTIHFDDLAALIDYLAEERSKP